MSFEFKVTYTDGTKTLAVVSENDKVKEEPSEVTITVTDESYKKISDAVGQSKDGGYSIQLPFTDVTYDNDRFQFEVLSSYLHIFPEGDITFVAETEYDRVETEDFTI